MLGSVYSEAVPVSRIVSLVSRSQCRGSVSLVSRSESLINCGSDRSMAGGWGDCNPLRNCTHRVLRV